MNDFILKCSVHDGDIHIVISKKAVVFIAENHEEFFNGEGETEVEVIDVAAFVHDVAAAISEEEEDGTTLMHIMMESATKRAIENGCDGVEA